MTVHAEAPAAAVAPGRTGRYVWFPVPAPGPAPDLALLRGRRMVVLGGTVAARTRVVDALHEAAVEAVASDVGATGGAPGLSDAHLLARSAALVADLGGIDGIVDLGVGGTFTLSDPGPWRAALRDSIALLKAVYEDWAAETDSRRLSYLAVTRMGGAMGYDGNGIAQPLGGIWAGLAKSLPQEIVNCRVKVLDLAEGEDVGRRVVDELATRDVFEVGHRGGERIGLAADARALGPPRLQLGTDDAVLVSGGARGLGFALAWRLADDVGCDVVVTGRSEPPSGREDWAAMSDEAFSAYARTRFRGVAGGADVRAVRAELRELTTRRALHHNLERARQAGVPITYRRCDVTDPAAVRRVVEAIGPRLRVVVHNAGVASPTRLRNKSLGSVLHTVATKVDGFIALAAALEGRDIVSVCNVGSVSGRLGGMIGQIDYAAANEALTRLGFWAADLPVTTLCWPTWTRLGLVSNFDAALRYAAAIDVDEGVDHWVRELTATERGEVMYLGSIGAAVTPSQLDGFRSFRGHPDVPRLASLHHYLGEVRTFAPFRELRSRCAVPPQQPACGELRVGGRAALSVGLALEYARAVGAWVVPEGWPQLWLHEIRDVSVNLTALAFGAGDLLVDQHGRGARDGTDWLVDVTLSTSDARLLTAQLCYRDTSPPAGGGDPVHAVDRADDLDQPGGDLEWAWIVHERARWTRSADGGVRAVVHPTPATDLWTMAPCPEVALPHAALENVLAAASATATATTGSLRIASLALRSGAGPEAVVEGAADRRDWRVLDADGREALALRGVMLG